MTDAHARFRTGQPGRHSRAERGLDHYETPRIAVEALLVAESKRLTSDVRIWEPCAGRGNIVAALRDRGFPVIASDLVECGFPLHFTADFLVLDSAPIGCTAIVTNPPYSIAGEFAERAIRLVPHVCLLLRLAFLESVRRSELLEHSGLRAVHVFRRRLPRMHRVGWTGPRASSSVAFAWFCWSAGHIGPPIITRI
jgi:hypothetical protein